MEVDPKLDVMAQQASSLSSGLCADKRCTCVAITCKNRSRYLVYLNHGAGCAASVVCLKPPRTCSQEAPEGTAVTGKSGLESAGTCAADTIPVKLASLRRLQMLS